MKSTYSCNRKQRHHLNVFSIRWLWSLHVVCKCDHSSLRERDPEWCEVEVEGSPRWNLHNSCRWTTTNPNRFPMDGELVGPGSHNRQYNLRTHITWFWVRNKNEPGKTAKNLNLFESHPYMTIMLPSRLELI